MITVRCDYEGCVEQIQVRPTPTGADRMVIVLGGEESPGWHVLTYLGKEAGAFCVVCPAHYEQMKSDD